MQSLVVLVMERTAYLMEISRETYQVNPFVFLVLYFGLGPVFYYALYRVVRAVIKALHREISLWSTVFLISTAAPFIYVLAFGRNLPWWSYGVISAIVLQAILMLLWKLRQVSAPKVRNALRRLRTRKLAVARNRFRHPGESLARRCHGLSHTIARVARLRPLHPGRRHTRLPQRKITHNRRRITRPARRIGRPAVTRTARRFIGVHRSRPPLRVRAVRIRAPRIVRLRQFV